VKLLMKQDSTTVGPVVDAFGLSAEERQFLLGAGKGEGLLCARGGRIPLRVEASPLEHQLATTAPRELETAARDAVPQAPDAVAPTAKELRSRGQLGLPFSGQEPVTAGAAVTATMGGESWS